MTEIWLNYAFFKWILTEWGNDYKHETPSITEGFRVGGRPGSNRRPPEPQSEELIFIGGGLQGVFLFCVNFA